VLTPEQAAAAAAAAQASQENAPHRYALGDRVADGVTIRINRVLVVVRLRGLLKDAPAGPWSPPALVLELKGLNLRSCDEGGDEHGGDLLAIWRIANRKAQEVRSRRSQLPVAATLFGGSIA
jgi:hypothetical protein